MPEIQLPSTSDRSDCRRIGRAWDVVVPGCLLGISSNTHASARRGKTAFITPHGLLCYNVIMFGLKNAGATYQRLVTKMFRLLLRKTIKVYIDDMLVKSKERLNHAEHLQEAFELLRAYGMKLKPSKCTFEVNAGRFLGFMVTYRGIETNPAQLKAILGVLGSHFWKRGTTVDWLVGRPRAIHFSIYRLSKAVLCHP